MQRRKDSLEEEGLCGMFKALYAIENQNLWHMDSVSSKHITCDPTKFLSLKRMQKGNVTFEDNLSSKIIRKGTMASRDKMKAENVMLVENLKPNLLSNPNV